VQLLMITSTMPQIPSFSASSIILLTLLILLALLNPNTFL
jgi:hypothetical protein